jgi:hypothetical protein
VAEAILFPLSLGLLAAACGLGEVRLRRPRGPAGWAAVAAGALVVLVSMLATAVVVAAVVVGVVALAVALGASGHPALIRLAFPVALLTALTVAQPLGVRAEPVPAPSGPAVPGREDVRSAPPLRFRLYENPISHLGLGECCPPQDTLRVRSWVLVPGLLTNAADVTDLHGDGVPSSWTLQRSAGDWLVRANSPSPRPDLAWRLEPGVVSGSGVAFWLAFAAAVVFRSVVRRRGAAPS